MFPSAKKRPDMSIMLGIGKKPPADQPPPSFGRKPMPEMPAEEAPGENEGAGGIPPDAVSYRTSAEQCQSCEYMGDDGNCEKLKMPVEADSGCNLHQPKSGGDGAGDETPSPDMQEQPA